MLWDKHGKDPHVNRPPPDPYTYMKSGANSASSPAPAPCFSTQALAKASSSALLRVVELGKGAGVVVGLGQTRAPMRGMEAMRGLRRERRAGMGGWCLKVERGLPTAAAIP